MWAKDTDLGVMGAQTVVKQRTDAALVESGGSEPRRDLRIEPYRILLCKGQRRNQQRPSIRMRNKKSKASERLKGELLQGENKE